MLGARGILTRVTNGVDYSRDLGSIQPGLPIFSGDFVTFDGNEDRTLQAGMHVVAARLRWAYQPL